MDRFMRLLENTPLGFKLFAMFFGFMLLLAVIIAG